MDTAKRKPRTKPRVKVRLAEEPGPAEALEEAIEARLDALFLDAVERAGGPLSPVEREALKRRMRYRVKAKALGQDADSEVNREITVVPPTLYADLKSCGILTEEEIRDIEQEQRAALPGAAHGYAPSLPCPKPTNAAPGSPEKILVMQVRARNHQSLHHPQDRTLGAGIFAAGLLARAKQAEVSDDDDD